MSIARTLSVFASMIDFSIPYAFTSCDGADPASDEGWSEIGFPDNPILKLFFYQLLFEQPHLVEGEDS